MSRYFQDNGYGGLGKMTAAQATAMLQQHTQQLATKTEQSNRQRREEQARQEQINDALRAQNEAERLKAQMNFPGSKPPPWMAERNKNMGRSYVTPPANAGGAAAPPIVIPPPPSKMPMVYMAVGLLVLGVGAYFILGRKK